MRTTEERIRELIVAHDEEKIVRLLTQAERRAGRRSELLRRQADIAANLRYAYMETELDRDRLQRLCTSLFELCSRKGLEREAQRLAKRYGGVQGAGAPRVVE